jgi:chromosome segregation ATPase
MDKMAGRISRFFKPIWYRLAGRSHELYEEMIQEKKKDIQHYKSAIGELVGLVKYKEEVLDNLTEEVKHLENLKSGALAKAESVETQLQQQGQTQEAIKQNPDYMKYIASYNDFSSTLNEKNTLISELKAGIERTQDDVERHRFQLVALTRELDAESVQKGKTDTLAAIGKREKHLHNLLRRLHATLSKGKGGV